MTMHTSTFGRPNATLRMHAFSLLLLAVLLSCLSTPVQATERTVTQHEYALFKQAHEYANANSFAKAANILAPYFNSTRQHHLFAYELYGYVLLQLNRASESVRIQEQGIATYPANITLAQNLGSAYARLGNHSKAGDTLLKAYALGGNQKHGMAFSAAQMFAQAKQFNRAREVLTPLVSLPEARPDWFLLLAQCQNQDSLHADAVQCLLKGIRKFPENSTLWRMLGYTHYQRGNQEKATAAYEVATRLAPPSDSEIRQLASLYSSLGAPLLCQKALGNKPTTPAMLDNLAYGFAGAGDMISALEKMDDALRQAPTPERTYRKGQILLRMRRMQEAREVFQTVAAQQGPWQGKALWALSMVAWLEGDWHETRIMLEKVAATDNKLRKRAHKLLAVLDSVTAQKPAGAVTGRGEQEVAPGPNGD